MAKESMIQRNRRKRKCVERYASRRVGLKKLIKNKSISIEERFEAQNKLASLPRNASKVRVRNICALSGRPRGYIRKFKLSRIAFREMASFGLLPGVIKSSY